MANPVVSVVISAALPWARELAAQFVKHGRAAEVRGNGGGELSRGDPGAVLLAYDRWDGGAHGVAENLRAGGFKGALLALGRVPPDLDARQRLAVSGVSYLPAFTNPEDVVARVRMILS